MTRPVESGAPCRIGLAGLGTVGGAVARLLSQERERLEARVGRPLLLSCLLDRSHRSKNFDWLDPSLKRTDSVEEFLADPHDVAVELLGGQDPADRIIRCSLEQGKSVVTANKHLVSRFGREYVRLSRSRGGYLGLEATVAGGIPILRVLRRSLAADQICGLTGILNGTCNFILSEMARTGRPFFQILKEAQQLGYAEADPQLDLSGQDSAEKLAILVALAFGHWIDPERIPVQGIQELDPVDLAYARMLKAEIRLLGLARLREGQLHLRVSPFLVDRSLPLAGITGVFNAVEVEGRHLGPALFSGQGAGGEPTAVSVVADILSAAALPRGPREPSPEPTRQTSPLAPAGRDVYPFYLRFFVRDQPGILAACSQVLARLHINIDSVLQEPWKDRESLPFTICLDETPVATVEKALAELARFGFNRRPPLACPILRPTGTAER